VGSSAPKLISIVPYGEARRGRMVSIEAWEIGRANSSREDNSGTGPAGEKLKVETGVKCSKCGVVKELVLCMQGRKEEAGQSLVGGV
jgi:hypothetical protein